MRSLTLKQNLTILSLFKISPNIQLLEIFKRLASYEMQSESKKISGTFSVQQQNQNYLPWGTSTYIKFGSEAKTGSVVELSSFRPYFTGFDQVDKRAQSSVGWRGKNSFSFDPIKPQPKVFPNNKSFLNRNFFLVKIDKILNFTPITIKPLFANIFGISRFPQ